MRLATWNTWWCFASWEQRQAGIDRAVADSEAEVVLLQETWPDQAERIARHCGLAVVDFAGGPFDPPVLDTVAADHPFGNAILAEPGRARALGRCPLATSDDDAAPRSGVGAVVEVDGGTVTVVSTHLNHLFDGGPIRVTQLEALGRWLDAEAPAGPIVLGGDLNLTPSSQEYGEAIAGRWGDAWTLAHPDDHGATMAADNPRLGDTSWMADRNRPGDPPGVRLDYLLLRDPAAVSVRSIDRFGGEEHGWPSDHLGLVADLALPEPT